MLNVACGEACFALTWVSSGKLSRAVPLATISDLGGRCCADLIKKEVLRLCMAVH